MTYEERHKKLSEYLTMKVEEEDWHGVSDASNDLRVLEAEWHFTDERLQEMAAPAETPPRSEYLGLPATGDVFTYGGNIYRTVGITPPGAQKGSNAFIVIVEKI